MDIKNIVIIAHVDHGKTTLVDALLKQTHTFRDNQKEMGETLIMDSNDLEREKGITILAKNTSVFYKDVKINIIDTPGHADFGGEVERVINMADGAILLVDASEGPLPQTKFVLRKAIERKLKIILLINKIDKRDKRVDEVMGEVEDLFLELAHDDESLHFETLYAVGREGKAFYEMPEEYSEDLEGDLSPLFETILKVVPNAAVNEDKPFQMLISTLDYDNYVGRLSIGVVKQGKLRKGDKISLIENEKLIGSHTVQKLYTYIGLNKKEVEEVTAGDIIALAGIADLTIGQTVTDPAHPNSLPAIAVEEPTIKVTIGPNTSPFAGKEGKFFTSRQIKERLSKEKETNLGLRIEDDQEGVNFVVHGRGELHLAMLIETMRREGYELQVSKPHVIFKTIDGVVCEPYEEVTIDVDTEHVGYVNEEFGKRKAEMINMVQNERTTRVVFKISSQNLLGIRSILMTKTRGTAVMSNYALGYFPKGQRIDSNRNGALIASQTGVTMTYGLVNAQDRGTLFVGPGVQVYEGMVVGLGSREFDIEVHVCREKKLTNNRSSGDGVADSLTPASPFTLEEALDFINDDEMVEVTMKNIRIRKTFLKLNDRKVSQRKG
ncbi:translational GTPase TypA [Candidatus Woesebacteria bacterium]|nr:translational GTPase TypA [Candidatus Woesebacteria bacterium]